MADEILWSSFSGDAGLTQSLNEFVHENLVDTVDLSAYCVDMGDFAGSGSSTKKTTTYTKNNSMAAAGSENASVANSAVTSGNFTLTVARQTIAFERADFAAILKGNVLEMQDLVDMIVQAAINRRTAMITALFSGFSTSKGTSSGTLTVDDVLEGYYALHIALNGGDIVTVLKPKGFTQFAEDMRSEGGSAQWQDATEAMLQTKPVGVLGTWRGITFVDTDRVTDDATDFAQGMFTNGAIYKGFASAQSQAGTIELPQGSSILVEALREARTAESAFVGHDYFGVTEGEDGRGIHLISGV